jgi:hypothetical protein
MFNLLRIRYELIMKKLYFLICLLSVCICLGAQNIFSVHGTKTFMNGDEIQVIGLRCSNSLITEKATTDMINYLDEYQSYGINTISVFFMGSRFGDVKGYNEDASLNPEYLARMAKIIEACDERKMVVLVGCLYWGNSRGKWDSWDQQDVENAVANTVRWLSENHYRNVIVDPDNEGMAQREKGFDISRMIKAGKEIDPTVMIGYNSRGYPPSNADLALHFSEIDPDKPYIESEGTMTDYWGAYSKEQGLYEYINVGIYTEGKKAEQIKNTDKLLKNGYGYMFASTWLQNVPPNHDPGGEGTHCDPGIRWWLEYIKENY